jgi:two-component system, chemotaxis family, protein-glutamate methylesterase/glutaminase
MPDAAPRPTLPPRRAAPIRVLLADDCEAAQRELALLLSREPGIEVVGRARDGEEALRLALHTRPHCICLDLAMPHMDGFTFLRLLMSRQPTPVIVVSASAVKRDVFKALELGALDFVAKPAPGEGRDLSVVREELLAKMETLRALRVEGAPAAPPAPAQAPAMAGRPTRLAVIGASTGGPPAVGRLLAALPRDLPLAFAVAQHMPEKFTHTFAERLARRTGLDVREAREGEELADRRVLVAPGGKHLRLVRTGGPLGPVRATLVEPGPSDAARWCPSVDLLFTSAADTMGHRVCAVVLTGMGSDGRRGVERVKEAGGLALAESEASAVVFGMPREAADTGKVDEVLPLDAMADRLRRFAEGA